MPLVKMSGFGWWLGKGVFHAAKGLTTHAALPIATGSVKGVANVAGFTGKQIMKNPKRAMGIGFGAMTVKDIGDKHLGQSWKMNQYAPTRFN